MFNYFSHKFWVLKRRLVPPEDVAGIEVTDAFLRLLLLDPERLNIVSAAQINLPKGTILSGKVQSLSNLEVAFRKLKNAAGQAFSTHPLAILALPPADFFTHLISLPDIPEESFEEAARLNAAQLSPIKMQDAYFDWQNLGVNLETLERELYIAVAAKDIINPYLEATKRAGIDIIAVEPASLGLIRVFNYFVTSENKKDAFLLIRVSSDGMDFVITKEGKPFFSYFFFWQEIPEAAGGKIAVDDFKVVTRRGIAKVFSFFTTRYKEQLINAAIIAPIFQQELVSVLKEEFGMKVAGYRFPFLNEAHLPETWAGALGAALRGIMPRAEDKIVSLMPLGTEELFRRSQLESYINFWGKVFATAFSLFIIVFAAIFIFAAGVKKNTVETLEAQQKSGSVRIAQELTQKAKEFNQLVSAVRLIESQERGVINELKPIVEAASNKIIIRQLSIFIETKEIRIFAFSSSRQGAVEFSNLLSKSGKFSKVDLPLAFVRDVPGGVEFTVNILML